jgi:D-aminoacyl-tRNA deacylase
MAPDEAKELYDYFFSKLQDLHGMDKVKNGVFQAMMEVSLVNDGPVSVSLKLSSRSPQSITCSIYVTERQ